MNKCKSGKNLRTISKKLICILLSIVGCSRPSDEKLYRIWLNNEAIILTNENVELIFIPSYSTGSWKLLSKITEQSDVILFNTVFSIKESNSNNKYVIQQQQTNEEHYIINKVHSE